MDVFRLSFSFSELKKQRRAATHTDCPDPPHLSKTAMPGWPELTRPPLTPPAGWNTRLGCNSIPGRLLSFFSFPAVCDRIRKCHWTNRLDLRVLRGSRDEYDALWATCAGDPLILIFFLSFFFSECAPFTVVPSSRGCISGFRASGKSCLFRLWMTIMGKLAHAVQYMK